MIKNRKALLKKLLNSFEAGKEKIIKIYFFENSNKNKYGNKFWICLEIK